MPVAAVVFLTLVNLLNYFDRYIVQAVEPTITQEFLLSNTQAGYVVSAFVIGYCFFSPMFGFLGDRFDRRRVMALGLVAWSGATWLTSTALTAAGFIGARILVGVGEACYGAIVPVYLKGRIGDTVALNRALSVFYVAIPVGSALGYVAGGQVAAEHGWRVLFSWAAVPGVILALGFLFLRSEASLGAGESAAPAGGILTGFRRIVGSPLLSLLIAGYVLNTFALNGVAAFVVRHGVGLGLGEAESSTYFGLILVVTGLGGTLGGGFLASRYAARSDNSVRSLAKFVAYSTLAAVPFLFWCFLARSSELFLTACFLAELFIFAGVAPLNSVIVARAPLGYEGFTQGVTIFSIQMFGGFLGPVIVGALTDASGSLAIALQSTSVALLLSGYLWVWAIQYVEEGVHVKKIDGRDES